MYCKKCGKQISDDSKYCKYCGILVDETAQLINSYHYARIKQLFCGLFIS